MDYAIPRADSFGHISAVTLENFPTANNPLGAKGAGEGGVIPAGGAVANAIAAALQSFGVRPNELPLTASRVWTLINRAAKPK
jgi:carbon-monoxide dehydrogenase large subunit